MTILAGFVCDDGYVLGSDSEETRTLLKVQVPKIEVIEGKYAKCVVAGAGNADLLTLALEHLNHSFGRFRRYLHDLRHELTYAVTDVHSKHVAPDDTENTLSLLSVIWSKHHGSEMVRTSPGITVPVKRHDTLGYGQDLARYLIETLYDEEYASLEHMQRLTAYVLQQTKKFAPYCGGESQIVSIASDGTIFRPSPMQVFSDEQFATVLSATSRDLFYDWKLEGGG